jgi:hypothetical protein
MGLYASVLRDAFKFTSNDPNTSLFNEPMAIINIIDGSEANISEKILTLNAPLQHKHSMFKVTCPKFNIILSDTEQLKEHEEVLK